MSALIAEWATWMRSEGLSERTIGHRIETVARFERLGLDLVGADSKHLAEFLASQRNAWGAATRANYHRALTAWYRWLVRCGHRSDNPLEQLRAPRVPRGVPRPVKPDQLRDVLAVPGLRRRTRTMILLAAYEGLRVHEIAKIRGEHFGPAGLRVIGKGGVEAVLPVHPLIDVERRRYPARGWWFPSYVLEGQPVDSRTVSTVVGDTLRRAGVDATAHQLRHFFGTEILQACGNLRTAQELLRHADLSTTAIYTRVDDSDRRAAILGLPVVGAAR